VDELAERFARAERQGLIEIVRAHVDIPLAELLLLIDEGRTGRMLGSLTIAECSEGRANEDSVELLNKAGHRAAYDARILDALRDAGEPLSPTEIQERVGGTAQEARTALQRLAAAKKVTRTWKERGHGYLLVG
jgi:DNA-binding Lrp family transcriptional regulator